MSAVLVGASVLCLAIWRPVPGGHFYIFSAREPGERVAAMRAALRLVPADAPVTATNQLGRSLSAREVVFSFPRRSQAAWIAIDTRDSIVDEREDRIVFARFLEELDTDPGWARIFDREGVRVYRRAP